MDKHVDRLWTDCGCGDTANLSTDMFTSFPQFIHSFFHNKELVFMLQIQLVTVFSTEIQDP